jgi:hypothetical protein
MHACNARAKPDGWHFRRQRHWEDGLGRAATAVSCRLIPDHERCSESPSAAQIGAGQQPVSVVARPPGRARRSSAVRKVSVDSVLIRSADGPAPCANVPSLPGRGRSQRSAAAARPARRGSTTISLAPRFRACCDRRRLRQPGSRRVETPQQDATGVFIVGHADAGAEGDKPARSPCASCNSRWRKPGWGCGRHGPGDESRRSCRPPPCRLAWPRRRPGPGARACARDCGARPARDSGRGPVSQEIRFPARISRTSLGRVRRSGCKTRSGCVHRFRLPPWP